ncbi:unnamed protein product [Trichobilharzia regenti]|nr:unnamed protein product [Trichobilharzia regenti]
MCMGRCLQILLKKRNMQLLFQDMLFHRVKVIVMTMAMTLEVVEVNHEVIHLLVFHPVHTQKLLLHSTNFGKHLKQRKPIHGNVVLWKQKIADYAWLLYANEMKKYTNW